MSENLEIDGIRGSECQTGRKSDVTGRAFLIFAFGRADVINDSVTFPSDPNGVMDRHPAPQRSRHRLGLLLVAAVALSTAPGCRICGDCNRLDYPTYGGAWERTRRDSGRVGSIFDPAGARSPELADRDTPPTPDMWQRERSRSPDEAGPADGLPTPFDLDSSLRSPEQADAERERRRRALEDLRLEDINQE